MRWFRNLFRTEREESKPGLKIIQDKFSSFLELLETNNKVLKAISDMEEKSQGDFLFDLNYVRSSLNEVRSGTRKIIGCMIALGGSDYSKLEECYRKIDAEVSRILPCDRVIEEGDFTVPFGAIGSQRAFEVGSKNAQLGEMRSSLGLPTPDGFAITAWAYKHFIESNDLQNRITDSLSALDFKQYQDLMDVSRRIQALVMEGKVPDDLGEAIAAGYQRLKKDNPSSGFALRSSAIGEDTQFSFAGQYRSLLNIRGDEIVDRYVEVVASKFTPQAIYYLLSHSLSEAELAMCVGCVVMVAAKASGVIYTKDPVDPGSDHLLINSIYGLGKYLVDGKLTPDSYRVCRGDGSLAGCEISKKPVRLEVSDDGGTVEAVVPEKEQNLPSLNNDQVKLLTQYALAIEEHYGCPQDIEWAIDHDGDIYLLQTRPLRIVQREEESRSIPDMSTLNVLMRGGSTISPGVGAGEVHHAMSSADLPSIPEGSVLTVPGSFPGIITVMGKINALITEVGGIASHMATIAREYRIPTLGGVKLARRLPEGEQVTVDATTGIVYEGKHEGLFRSGRKEDELFSDTDIMRILETVLKLVSPLNLVHPTDPGFVMENCMTFHDIARFAHQKSMDEMFFGARELKHKGDYSLKLKTDFPLRVNMIYIDRDIPDDWRDKQVKAENIHSGPMRSFWDGISKEGWPAPPVPRDIKGLAGVLATSMTRGGEEEFAENSFAILSETYMVLSLRMGYHFTTIEAMATDEVSNNYIRMQFKEGGAAVDRRIRRINLLVEILSKFGFENFSKGDFLDARLSYRDAESIRTGLYNLGRLTMLTKQLDMALSNDSIAAWYTRDILKKLGLEGET
jgi:pyruvate,water dikinase